MDTPSYIASNPDQLFEQAPPYIQELVSGNEVNTATTILGKLYKLPVNMFVPLENIITFILIGALKPEDAVRAIMDILRFSQEDAVKLATDMEKTILEKARITILGKSPKDMVTLTFKEGRSPDELRKEILDTTNRIVVPPPSAEVKAVQAVAKPASSQPGTRSQLLEQLQILDDIPNDEEINERLQKIQAQIKSIEPQDERQLESPIALQEFMPKKGDDIVVEPKIGPGTYSKAPTKYNIDPYREAPE